MNRTLSFYIYSINNRTNTVRFFLTINQCKVFDIISFNIFEKINVYSKMKKTNN
jgi:hypothetical protein